MLKFDGPHFEPSPHARFLYQSFPLNKEKGKEKADLSVLYKVIVEIDKFIACSPRIDKAHESAYIYLFGPESGEFWVGREITGFIPNSVQDFKVFDSYRGEVITWDMLGDMTAADQDFEQWILHAQQLRSLAGEALAMTWRIKIGSMEMLSKKSPLKFPKISFQFFKTH